MIEGTRLAAGEGILSGVAATDRTSEERTENEDGRVESHRDILEGLLEELVRQHSRLVYRIAYAVLRRHHDAEDSTQETFMRVLRYSSKLAAVDDRKTWLARIAWRVAVDRSRQRGSAREIPLEDPDKPVAELASSAAPADQTAAVVRERFAAVLGDLPGS